MSELITTWDIPPIVTSIGDIASRNNLKAWIVGGWVRDALLGKPGKDIDITVEAPDGGNRLAHLAAKALNLPAPAHYRRTGAALISHEGLTIEFTSTRSQSYRNDGMRDTSFGTFSEDILHRDFTINTLALELPSGKICDMTGNGIHDLRDRIINTPAEPEITFSDDPLRIMRAARFACRLGMIIHPRVLAAAPALATGLKSRKVAPERIGIELVHILKTPDPAGGIDLCQALGVNAQVLPEISDLADLEQPHEYHHKDVYMHTLDVLRRVAEKTDDPVTRLSALLHDVGKSRTRCLKKSRGRIRWTFHNHDVVGARMAKSIARRLKIGAALETDQNHLEERIFTVIRYHLSHLEASQWADSAVRRFIHRAGDALDDLLTVMECDIVGHKNPQTRGFSALKKRIGEVNLSDLTEARIKPAVSGDILMKTYSRPPGQWIGLVHRALKQAVIDGDVPPGDEEAAWKFIRERFNENGDPVGGIDADAMESDDMESDENEWSDGFTSNDEQDPEDIAQ